MDTPIARFSLWFTKRFRVSFLLLFSLLILGYLSYTQFLKREGFPPIEVPIAVVQTTYFVNDTARVNDDVTVPLEHELGNIDAVRQIQSTTTENVSILVVEFTGDTTASEGAELLRAATRDLAIPEAADVTVQTIDAGAVDGEHEMLINLSGDHTVEALQDKAEVVAERLEENALVTDANAIRLITEETNPLTGETFSYQSTFSRVGQKRDDTLAFAQSVAIGIKTQDTTGSIELSEAVRDKIDRLADEGLLDGYDVSYGGDFAVSLQDQISSLESNALSGLIAVVVILFFFISWRASLLGAVFIPSVLATTFVALYLIGYSLNVISLFALILVLGLFVDDAIVVVEAIARKVEEGKRGIRAVGAAISDIGISDVSGTLTTVLVFVPMVFTSGVLGEFIRLIPVTVILALFISLVTGLAIMPLLSLMLLRPPGKPHHQGAIEKAWLFFLHGFGNLLEFLDDKLGRFVTWYLARWWRAAFMLILSLGLIVGGGYYAGKLQFSVFPAPKDTDQINISILYPPGTDLATAEDTAKAVESILVDQAEDYVEAVTYFIANRTEAYLAVDLTPMEERDLTSGEIVAELQSLFADYGETRIRVAQASVGPPAEEYPYTMQVYADSPETLRTATEDIRRFIAGVTLSDDIEITDTLVQNLDTVAKIDGRRYAVVRAKISDETNTGAIIEIRDQVEAEYTETRLTALGLDPDALGFDFGQESENISSFSSTIFALLVALIAMYALLVVQYNSFLQPFLIFLAIPFSFPGLFPGLFLTDNALSFFVMVGILSLVGITVNNTIMLTDFANREHEENPNKRLRENIAQALRIRFRPILATSATTVAGLLPLALSDPFWESLAYTIIFGLISSTLMVLLFFPVYYWLVERLRKALHRVIPGFGLKDLDRQPQA